MVSNEPVRGLCVIASGEPGRWRVVGVSSWIGRIEIRHKPVAVGHLHVHRFSRWLLPINNIT